VAAYCGFVVRWRLAGEALARLAALCGGSTPAPINEPTHELAEKVPVAAAAVAALGERHGLGEIAWERSREFGGV